MSDDAPVSYTVFNEHMQRIYERLDADREETKRNFEKVFEQLAAHTQELEASRLEREADRKEREADRKEREAERMEREDAKKKREEIVANMKIQWNAGNYLAYCFSLASIHKGTQHDCSSSLMSHYHTKVE